MKGIIILLIGILFIVWLWVALTRRTNPSTEFDSDVYIIRIIDLQTNEEVYSKAYFASNKETAERYAFAHFKSFYDDKYYEVGIDDK